MYESTSATGSYTQVATPASTSHSVSGKAPGTYYYKVAACNGAGNSTCSAQSSASSAVVVNAPAATETVTYLHSDTLGNVIGESKADGSFTRYHYKPYGERVESAPERLGFTGHLHQKELGLTYMQARHFDPLMGRFYGNDPVGFTGNLMTFNRYVSPP